MPFLWTVLVGAVLLDGRPLHRVPPYAIARAGVGRTFQIVHDFPGLTIEESVRVGALFGRGGGTAAERTEGAIRLLGLQARAAAHLRGLPGADRRRVELAKAVAMAPRLLLLDEVMVGLNLAETEELIGVLRHLNHTGVAIVMVEHVMRAVMSLCDRVVVLHRGQRLAEGTPETITRDERVIDAYLGSKFRRREAPHADAR